MYVCVSESERDTVSNPDSVCVCVCVHVGRDFVLDSMQLCCQIAERERECVCK